MYLADNFWLELRVAERLRHGRRDIIRTEHGRYFRVRRATGGNDVGLLDVRLILNELPQRQTAIDYEIAIPSFDVKLEHFCFRMRDRWKNILEILDAV